MTDKIYFDFFANQFVMESERDDTAPPERYALVTSNNEDIYIETWRVGHNQRLDIAYTSFDRDHGYDADIRSMRAKENNVRLYNMVHWSVPKEHYNGILKLVKLRLNLEE